MKNMLRAATALAALTVIVSSAQAAISIQFHEVRNGVTFIQGRTSVGSAPITWEGGSVTTASVRGAFSFYGVLPADCVGSLSDGQSTTDVSVLNCTPVTVGPPAPVAKTGQTVSLQLGDDGDLEKGVASPNPRFRDNGNGTITDFLTGLIWLKNTDCLVFYFWSAALSAASTIANGYCGLSDGSVPGDWRLPNARELHSLVDFGNINPAAPVGNPFSDGLCCYLAWTSTISSTSPWVVDFANGSLFSGGGAFGPRSVLVRGGS